MKAMNLYILLICILVKFECPQSLRGQITVTGGSGTTLKQHQQSNPSRVDIGTENDISEHDLLIHIQHKRHNDQLSAEQKKQAEHVTKQAKSQKEKPNVCQHEIDERNTAKTERNIMAIHIASREIELRKLQQQIQMLKAQLSLNSGSIQTPIEVPIIIDHAPHATNTLDIDSNDKYTGTEQQQNDSVEESTENVDRQNGTESTEKKNDVPFNKPSKKRQRQTTWSNWIILSFIMLLLIPLLIGFFFYCLSQKDETYTEDRRATFIVGDAGIQQNITQNGNEPHFTFNHNAFAEDDQRSAKESTNDDIRKLSDTMNEYLGNSSKLSVASEHDEIESISDPNLASVQAPKPRLSLVDQQIASDDET